MANYHTRGSWLLYLQGIQVPCTSANVNNGVFSFPEADISLPADPALIRLGKEDRIPAAIFYLDTDQTKNEGKTPEYRLLFDGEITGFSYQTTPESRLISFHCVSQTAIFTQLFNSYMLSVDDFAQGRFNYNDSSNTAVAAPLYPAALFFQGIDANSPLIKRPFDFVENIFKGLMDSASFQQKPNSSVSSAFFARWTRRTNFINRWAPSPFLENSDLASTDGVFPILRAFQQKAAVGALTDMATNMGNGGSYWDILTNVFRKVYYEVGMISAMPLVGYDLAAGNVYGLPEIANISTAVQVATNNLQTAQDAINSFFATNPSFSEGLASSTQSNTVQSTYQVLQATLESTQSAYEAAIAAGSTSTGRGPANPLKPLRLIQNITKPQLQFCCPPRCNVILPSMINSFSYAENYAQQPTRLYIHDETKLAALGGGRSGVTALAEAAVTTGFPPRVDQALHDAQGNLQRNNKNFILFPEEFFKGPVMDRETAPEWFFFLVNSLLGSANASTDQTNQITSSMHDMAALYAQYEFLKQRASNKTGSLSLRFHPYLAPGFPAVVFEHNSTNMHNFSYLINVTHSLTAASMNTSANYSYAQTFGEFFETLIQQRNGFSNAAAIPSVEVQNLETALVSAQAALVQAQSSANAAQITAAQDLVTKATADLSVAQGTAVIAASQQLAGAQTALEAAQTSNDSQQLLQAQQNVASAQASLSSANNAFATPDYYPTHPVPDIRYRFQVTSAADDYYAMTFQQGQKFNNLPAAFDWTKGVGVLNPNDYTLPPTPITVGTGQNITVTGSDGSQATQKQVTTNALDTEGNPVLYGPLGQYKSAAEDATSAMQFVGRPICSLEEYIDFQGDYGVRQGPVQAYPGGPTYYTKILDYTAGPGPEPQEDQFGNRTTSVTADTRLDWESRLLAYRSRILSTTSTPRP